jgi:hypothetical protein
LTTLAQISDLPTVADANLADTDLVEILNQFGGTATSRRLPFSQLKKYFGLGGTSGAEVNVKAGPYLATGNGATDDTTAVFAAFTDLLALGGGTLLFPGGTYILDWTPPTNVTASVRFVGVGRDATVLKFKNAGTTAIFKGAGTASTIRLSFRHLTIDGNRANQGAGVFDLVQYANAPYEFEDVDFKSFTARAIYGVSIPYFKLHNFTVSDVQETTDAAFAGGAGLGYLPTMTGPIDIAHGRFIQPAPSDARYAPFGLQIQGTVGQLLCGSIRDIYAEHYGHKSAGANPIGLLDIYNYGSDLAITEIVSRNPTYCAVKADNGARITIDARIIGQDNNFGAPAVQVGAGIHSVTGDFPDPEIRVKASGFTAGAVLQLAGSVGSEIKNPRVYIDARACLQALILNAIDGGDYTIVADGCTGTLGATSCITFDVNCKNRLVFRGMAKNGGAYAITVIGTAPNVDIDVDGMQFENNTPVHINLLTVRDVVLDRCHFRGTPNQAVIVNGANSFRARGCDGIAATNLSYTAIATHEQSGNSWNVASVGWNPPNLAAGAVQSTTVTLADALVGDYVDVAFSIPLLGTRLWGEVLAAGTVTVYQQNPTGGAVDVGAGTLTARVRRG